MALFSNDEILLSVTPMENLPESWRIQWKHWLDDLDADKISTADIRKILFQLKDKKNDYFP